MNKPTPEQVERMRQLLRLSYQLGLEHEAEKARLAHAQPAREASDQVPDIKLDLLDPQGPVQ